MIRVTSLLICCTTLSWSADELPKVTTPPTPTPVADDNAKNDAGNKWIFPLLQAGKTVITAKPEIATAKIALDSVRLSTRVAENAWNPRASFSPNFSERRSESNSVLDGPGIIKTQSGSASVSLSKPFATGTSVSIGGSSSGTTSNGTGVIRNDFYSSSVNVAISQSLLRGGNRTVNMNGILDAQDAEATSLDNYHAALETQYSDFINRWLNLALAEASIAQLRDDVKISKENLRQYEERLKIGLSRELDVQSLRRGVADQEVQLAKSERAHAAELRQMSLYWPEVTLPSRDQVLLDTQPQLPPLINFADTRQGQANLRDVAAAARRVAVTKNAAFDDLSAQGSISKYGSDGDLGGSWKELDNRNEFDWRVGLSYTHVFGTEANRVSYQQTLLALDQIRLRAQIAERDWHARALSLRDTFEDALARVEEQKRLVVAERNELSLATAQVEAGRTTTRDLVDAQQRVSNAILTLYRANLDVLRSDLNLRLHQNRLLDLLP